MNCVELKDLMEKQYGRKVVYVGLVGSHAKYLDTPKSDKDFKAMVLPNSHDLFTGYRLNKAHTSEEFDYEVKDVRLFVESWQKMNPNYLDMFQAREMFVEEGWEFLMDTRWLSYDVKKLMLCLCGTARSYLKEHETNLKTCANLLVLDYVANEVVKNNRYPSTFATSKEVAYAKALKMGNACSVEEARVQAMEASDHLDVLFNEWVKKANSRDTEFLEEFQNKVERKLMSEVMKEVKTGA